MSKKVELPRSQWIKALSQIKRLELVEQVQNLAKDWLIKPVSPPQSGLGALKLKESTMSEPFFLGEFPLSCVWIEISTPDGRVVQGAANVMHDDVEYAEVLAICDAVLTEELDGFHEIEALLAQGLHLFEEKEIARRKILASTRVDFSLLEDAVDPNKISNVAEVMQNVAS